MKTVQKLIFAGVILMMALFTLGVIAAQPSAASSQDPAIFLTPHQDDETLTMGAAIREHVLEGRRVVVVLLTDGGESGVCRDKYEHYTEDDGTVVNTPEGRAACVAERDREFVAAVTKMGAEPLIPDDRMKDGTLTGAYTAEVILRLVEQYPDASFKTMSEYDSIHSDHRAAGRGLYAAYLWGYTNDARWYLRYDDQGTYAGWCTNRHNLNTALDLYRPIGWESVPLEFLRVWNSPDNPAAYSKQYTPAQRKVAGNGSTCYPNG